MDLKKDYGINLQNACSYNKKGSKTCMSNVTIEKLKAQTKNNDFNNVIDKILKEKGTTIEELGLLLDARTISAIGKKKVLEELQTNFKPVGPVNTELFNNFVEDNVLIHVSKNWDPTFCPIDVNLFDFQQYGGTLLQIEPTKNGISYNGQEYKHFGCILNTLKKSGNLSKVGHWVAMYGDFRNNKKNTIEYFNSSGNPAPPEVFSFMEQLAQKCTQIRNIPCEAINASNIQHQKSNTECGAYALYYIFSRIVGHSHKDFRTVRIPDDKVTAFRKMILNDQNKIKNKSILDEYRLV